MRARQNPDADSVENQIVMEEVIRQERVRENLEMAYENYPESFGSVTMLYVNATVNDVPLKAFVDSGAQVTIMSPACAQRCGIMRLVDTKFGGIARGVGQARIWGRVHAADIVLGGLHLPCSFQIIEVNRPSDTLTDFQGRDMDFILGLDMLKRHQANIDLMQNALIIQGMTIPFLGESEIPKSSDEEWLPPNVVPTPSGAHLDPSTGAILDPAPHQLTHFQGPGHRLGSSLTEVPTQRDEGSHGQDIQHSQFPEEAIKSLMDLGVERGEAIQYLEIGGGNVDAAASMLFQS